MISERPNQTLHHRWNRKISVNCDILDLILGFKDRFFDRFRRSTQLTGLILISCFGTAYILLWLTCCQAES